jgi:zinc D-Ala-D-Ala carboxypeptidase
MRPAVAPVLILGAGLGAWLLGRNRARITAAARDIMGTHLSEHFTLEELTKTSQGKGNTPDAEALANLTDTTAPALEQIRALVGVPIYVSSGYRSPDVNAGASGSKTSDHMTGLAADIWDARHHTDRAKGYSNEQLATILYDDGGAIPLDQTIVEWHTGHLHVGFGSRQRRQFLQTFDGKTYSAWAPAGEVA